MSATAPPSKAVELTSVAASFTLLWAIELALARVTGQIQTWPDVIASAVLLVIVPILLVLVVLRSNRPEQQRRPLAGFIAALPLAAVAAGIAVPVAARYTGGVAATVLLLAIAGMIATNVSSARAGDGPAPSAGLVLGLVVGCAASAWVLGPTGFPPFQIHLPFLVAAVFLARLAVRGNAVPLVALGGIAFAFWPTVLPPPPWHDDAAASTRPDVVLVSIEAESAAALTSMPSYRDLVESGQTLTVDRRDTATVGSFMAAVLGAYPAVADEPAPASSAAERFAAAGYDTAAVVSAQPELDVPLGFHRGFAAFHHFIDRNRYALPRWRANLAPANAVEADFASRPVAADLLTGMGLLPHPPFANAAAVLEVAAGIMSERRAAPVFLWLHFDDSLAAVDVQIERVLRALGEQGARRRIVAILGVPSVGGERESVPLVIDGTQPPAADTQAPQTIRPREIADLLLAESGR